jgi:hypothetical protein
MYDRPLSAVRGGSFGAIIHIWRQPACSAWVSNLVSQVNGTTTVDVLERGAMLSIWT